VDEAPDYLYNAFREFPAQSRKYKVIITTLQQTIAQMADQFGEYYMTTIIGTMRNRMVYADIPPFDAKFFSEMFGEKDVYDEGQTEMAVSPLQEDPMSRSGSNYSRVREAAMTSGEIMNQAAFQCAVKIVVNNHTMPVVQLQANFLDKEEFVQSKYVADPDALEIWLRERRLFGTKADEIIDTPLISIEETEIENEKYYTANHKNANELPSSMIDQALMATVEPKPREELMFEEGEIGQHPPRFEKDGYILQTPLEQHEELVEHVEKVPVAATITHTSSVEKKQEPVSVSPALEGIVSAYDDEETEIVPAPTQMDIKPTPADEPLFEFVELHENADGYVESKLEQKQEDFVKQLGQSIQNATDR
jgi:hypothetical protein